MTIQRMMNWLLGAGVALGSSLSLAESTKPPEGHVTHANELKWEPTPPSVPPGGQKAMLYGDPAKAAPFAYRFKMPAGYKVAPHFHPSDELVTVIEGTLYMGMGDQWDEKAGHQMPPGTFSVLPAGSRHYVWTKGETIIQVNGTGPWGITYVNPADDPRNKKT